MVSLEEATLDPIDLINKPFYWRKISYWKFASSPKEHGAFQSTKSPIILLNLELFARHLKYCFFSSSIVALLVFDLYNGHKHQMDTIPSESLNKQQFKLLHLMCHFHVFLSNPQNKICVIRKGPYLLHIARFYMKQWEWMFTCLRQSFHFLQCKYDSLIYPLNFGMSTHSNKKLHSHISDDLLPA